MERRGFSIIEALLFVSISAVFIIIAATILRGRSRDVQFTDASRTIESVVEQVQDRVRNGVKDERISCTNSSDPASFPGSGSYNLATDGSVTNNGSCILLGEFIEFSDFTSATDRSDISVYPIYGRRVFRDTLSQCMEAHGRENVLWCVEPYAFKNVAVLEENIPWSVEIFGGTNGNVLSGSPVESNVIGFIRDPSSENIIPFALERGSAYSGDDLKDHFYDLTSPPDATRTSAVGSEVQDAYYCFQYSGYSDDFYTALLIGQSERQNDVSMEFDYSDCVTEFGTYR